MNKNRFDAFRPLGVLVGSVPELSQTSVVEEILGLERRGLALRLYALASPTDVIVHPALARVRAPLVRVPEALSGSLREGAARHARLFRSAPLRYLCALAFALRRGRHGAHEFARAGWLAGQLHDDGVECLHAHSLSAPADMAELVGRLSALPFSISEHARHIDLADPPELRRKLGAARFTVASTEPKRRMLEAIAPGAPVYRMHNGAEHSPRHAQPRLAAPNPPLIMSVGRLRAARGLDTLIDACAVLRERGCAFACDIVGSGEEQAHLQARIEGHGLADKVHLLGKLPREQVLARYARAAVYVQPSRIAAEGDRDAIQKVLLEAMAMGLPVVASRVSGIPELVDDWRNGLLVEPDDPHALADAIDRLLGLPRLCAEFGHRASRTITESFDSDINLKRLVELLQTTDSADAEYARVRPIVLGAAT